MKKFRTVFIGGFLNGQEIWNAPHVSEVAVKHLNGSQEIYVEFVGEEWIRELRPAKMPKTTFMVPKAIHLNYILPEVRQYLFAQDLLYR